MKIVRIKVYQLNIPIKASTISNDRIMSVFDETIVAIETDTGLVGWGESVPWGSNFVAAFARGVRAGIDELAPQLIGLDPRMIAAINEAMDFAMKGQGYVKSALDMACWDILGRSLDTPLYMLFGGMVTPAPWVIGSIPPVFDDKLVTMVEKLRQEGIKVFSSKTSGDVSRDVAYLLAMGELMQPGEALKYDGNGGWQVDEAIRIARQMGNIDIYFEQPCATYEECREVRRTTGVPLLLDESALEITDILRAKADGVLDALNLKISRVGGLTKTKLIRDLCVALNVKMEIQDSSYSELSCAASTHLAHATPGRCIMSIQYPKGLEFSKLNDAPVVKDGRVYAPELPGIGSSPKPEVIGDPIAVYE